MATITGVVVALGVIWYAIWGLKPYQVSQEVVTERYSYQKRPVNMNITQDDGTTYSFTYTSFDGALVIGRIRYPDNVNPGVDQVPVLLGIHAMGRSDNRWFMDSFKERPTLEQTDKITDQALSSGYAVIAIDSRNHGKRKDLDYTIVDVMNNMHYWGKREPYEQMVIDTVKDYRVLLDWVEQQPQFDPDKTGAAGYSMGGQVSLILASTDTRVEQVLSIVPPYLDNKTAIVAVKNIVNTLHADKVWLVTANDDEHASESENEALFAMFKTSNKKHVTFDGGHVLPEGYYKKLSGWFE